MGSATLWISLLRIWLIPHCEWFTHRLSPRSIEGCKTNTDLAYSSHSKTQFWFQFHCRIMWSFEHFIGLTFLRNVRSITLRRFFFYFYFVWNRHIFRFTMWATDDSFEPGIPAEDLWWIPIFQFIYYRRTVDQQGANSRSTAPKGTRSTWNDLRPFVPFSLVMWFIVWKYCSTVQLTFVQRCRVRGGEKYWKHQQMHLPNGRCCDGQRRRINRITYESESPTTSVTVYRPLAYKPIFFSFIAVFRWIRSWRLG